MTFWIIVQKLWFFIMSSTEEKVFNEKFDFIQSKIEDYITKRNLRQVQKYINELNALEQKYESCSINDKIAKIGNLKDIAEQFVDEQNNKRNNELLKHRFDSIISDINQFSKTLKTVTEKIPKGIVVERDNILKNIIKDLNDLFKESRGCDEEIKGLVKDLKLKLNELKEKFQSWKDICSNLDSKELEENFDESLNISMKSQTTPRIKLQALNLPTFNGNVRLFPKFLREFEITVEAQYSDPNTKLMILQNQCLSGAPKELIIHLTSFDEAMVRLNQHYGRSSLTVESVIKELKDFKLTQNDSVNIINLNRFLTSAEDDLKGVDSWDEFNNVVVLKMIENKMSLKNQEMWAEKKADILDKNSNEVMSALKNFIETRSKVALAFQNVGGTKSSEHNTKGVFNVSSVGEKKGCFRCGLTNHLIKDCKYPKTIKCRNCKKEGHLDRVCRHPKIKPNTTKSDNAAGIDNFSQKIEPKPVVNSNIMTNESIRLPFEMINTT